MKNEQMSELVRDRRPGVVRFALLGCLALTAAASSGCVQMAALWANMSGGDWIDPEHTLTKGPLLLLLDDPNEDQLSEPRVYEEVHRTISQNFLQFDVNKRVIPYEDWSRLRQSESKYAKLSAREIGEKLGAEQILYMRIVRFVLQPEPGAEIFQGEFTVNVKVLSTEGKRDIRLWPKDEGGRRVTVTTQTEAADGDRSAADVSQELAIKMGKEVAKIFYGHRSFDK